MGKGDTINIWTDPDLDNPRISSNILPDLEQEKVNNLFSLEKRVGSRYNQGYFQ